MDNLGLTESGKTVGDTSTIATAGPWTNPANIYDVNNLDGVTALDALLIINELGVRRFSDRETGRLDATTPTGQPIYYYDVSLDGLASALDALRVINQLARIRVAPTAPIENEGSITSINALTNESSTLNEFSTVVNFDQPTNVLLVRKRAAFDFAIRDLDKDWLIGADETETAIAEIAAELTPLR